MRRILYAILFLSSLLYVGCTKDNYIDTGISKGRFHGNLMQYMASNSYDWDSTILLVRHAGEEMVRLFEGKDPAHKEITFFGITNHSIRRHLLEFGHKRGRWNSGAYAGVFCLHGGYSRGNAHTSIGFRAAYIPEIR